MNYFAERITVALEAFPEEYGISDQQAEKLLALSDDELGYALREQLPEEFDDLINDAVYQALEAFKKKYL